VYTDCRSTLAGDSTLPDSPGFVHVESLVGAGPQGLSAPTGASLSDRGHLISRRGWLGGLCVVRLMCFSRAGPWISPCTMVVFLPLHLAADV